MNISAFLAAVLVPEELTILWLREHVRTRNAVLTACRKVTTFPGLHVLNSPTTKSILSQINPVPILSFGFFTIYFFIIHQFTPKSSLHIFLQKKKCISPLSQACYMLTHPVLLDLIVVIRGDEDTWWSPPLCNLPQFPVTFSSVQVNSTAPCSQEHSVMFPLMWNNRYNL